VKIVGVGLNRTGTSTLGACLQHWGLRHMTVSRAAFDLWRAGDLGTLLDVVAQYDSFEDWPWPLVYKAIDQAYPGSRFILTTRRDADSWFESLCAHAARTGPTDYRRYIYGHEMPHLHKAEHVRYYERHNEEVREHFRARPDDLLEVCWETGSGWHALGAFLGRPVPDLPFPHVNPQPSPHGANAGSIPPR